MTTTDSYLLPTSSGQRRLWLIDRLEPGNPAYVIAWRVGLAGPLDVAALSRVLAGLVRRHEALHTAFPEVDGLPMQLVTEPPPGPYPIRLLDLTDAGDAEVDAVVRHEARQPFDLAGGPVLRATLVRRAADRHVLVLMLHHAVADGWSCEILLDELTAWYAAELAGADPGLPELPVQYGDYAIWQREQVETGAFAAVAEHWRSRLAGAPTLLELPTDLVRPAEGSWPAATVRVPLDPAVLAEARALARLGGGTLFGTLLGVFAALLHRACGQPDLLVGTPVSGRTRAETERLVGFFVNTLALRSRVGEQTTMRELLRDVQQTVLDALANQELPFEELVDMLAPRRSLAVSPLVQVMFALEPHPAARHTDDLLVTAELVDGGAAKLDLFVTVEQDPYDEDRATLRAQYRTDLFDGATVLALLEAYAAGLAATVADPDRRVAELPLLAAPVRPAPIPPLPAAAAMPLELLRLDRPGTAVVGPDGPVSYAELDDRSARLAVRLGTLLGTAGADPQPVVAVCLDRGPAVLVALLAVWRAGAVHLPLDPGWPIERLRGMLADSGAAAVLTDGGRRDRLGSELGRAAAVVCLDDPLPEHPAGTPVHVRPDDLAYLLYTSGSTGRPKAVAVPHRALAHLVSAVDALLDLRPSDRMAALTSSAFDISLVELLVPLLRGAQVVTVDPAEVADSAALRRRIAATGVTVLQATPTTWRMLLAAGGVPAGVRLRVSGGEALSRELADELSAGGATVVNGYGPTETTVYSAAGPVAPGPALVGLGAPVGATRLHVLDPGMHPLPVGVVGELYVGGPGVARGYAGRPGATAGRFRPDPLGPPGARLFATGDLVRRTGTGDLLFLGRVDQQVKVRGHRIELGEIESVLVGHPTVREAVVTTWSGNEDDVRLVAYLVPDAGPAEAVDAVELWRQVQPWLARRLPEQMLPAACVVLAEVPRTAGGKTDRSALPVPVWRVADEPAPVGPRTPAEELLVRVWQDVLSLPSVGVHDNFFTLGGHSLTAARLVARIRTEFGVELPLRTLFAAPTVAELARSLDAPESGARQDAPGRLLDTLDTLSDLEIDRLLTLADPDGRLGPGPDAGDGRGGGLR